MNISGNGINVIKSFEGLRLHAYLDSASIWTIGYGTIIYINGVPVKQGDVITKEQADDIMSFQLKRYVAAINSLVTSSINQQQFDSLVSFAYNLGIGAFKGSTLLKSVNANPNDPAIKDELLKWVRASGKVVQGLVKRRQREAEFYFS